MSGRARLPGALALLGALAAAAGAAFGVLLTPVRAGGALGALVAAMLLGAAGGYAAGMLLARHLRTLRAVLLERASGDLAHPLPPTALPELGAVAAAADRISARLTRHAAQLERQRDELAGLVDSVSDGLLRTDASGRLTFLNPAARELLNLPGGALGEPLHTLVRDVELRDLLQRARSGERVSGHEIGLAERRVLVSAAPLRTGEGNAAELVLALTDLTALRRLEGVRRDFVANVSHELKTPLTSICGYVETLLQGDELPEVRQQFLQVVQRNAERLQRIVDELLDLARIESGGWQPEPQPIDVAPFVRDVWQSCEDRARQQEVSFVAPTSEAQVLADPGGLRQVLANLFDNAIRYTPAGGRIVVHVRIAKGTDARDWIVLEVQDTGSGIPRDALPRIFERFYRVDPARSREAGGTGLGLAIVKHLVETMGGSVDADSRLGRGTTLRIRLPAAS